MTHKEEHLSQVKIILYNLKGSHLFYLEKQYSHKKGYKKFDIHVRYFLQTVFLDVERNDCEINTLGNKICMCLLSICYESFRLLLIWYLRVDSAFVECSKEPGSSKLATC